MAVMMSLTERVHGFWCSVYGKMGLWEQAVKVLTLMKSEVGLMTEPCERADNTVMLQPCYLLCTPETMSAQCKHAGTETVWWVQGVEPVLRTYNTLIIACNMCGQPREAMAVYKRMLDEGYTPNATTYNALISAYGKAGQLDKVVRRWSLRNFRLINQ
jgi:pentatricopeptide repeat protein